MPGLSLPRHPAWPDGGVAHVLIFPLWQALGVVAILMAVIVFWRVRCRQVGRKIEREVAKRTNGGRP